MRIRSIKPEILRDRKAAMLPSDSWRLWVSSWVMADDAGQLPAEVGYLAGSVFWGQPDPVGVTVNALARLVESQLVELYVVHDEMYMRIRGWSKHQKIDHASGPKFPVPTEGLALDVSSALAKIREVSRALAPDHDREHEHEPDREHDGLRAQGALPATVSPALEELAAKVRKGARPPRAQPFPTDWEPRPQEREKATELGLDCDAQAEHFRDHHTAKGSRFTDWHAAFRNWLRNATRFANERKPAKQTGFDAVMRIAQGEPE